MTSLTTARATAQAVPCPPPERDRAEREARALARWRACWSVPLHVAVIDGPDAGWAVPLTVEGVRIGRADSADLRLADADVNRDHARIVTDRAGRVVLRPAPGAVVALRRARARRGAGRRVLRPTRLRPGDRVRVGRSTLEVRVPPARSRGEAPPAPRGRAPSRLLLALPVVAVIVVVAIVMGRGRAGGSGFLMAGMLASVVTTSVMVLSMRRASVGGSATTQGRRDPPGSTGVHDPAALAVLAAGLGDASAADLARVDEGEATGPGDRGGPTGHGVLVVGQDAAAAGRWLASQVTSRTGAAQEVRVWPTSGAPPPSPAEVLAATGPRVSAEWAGVLALAAGPTTTPGDLRALLADPDEREVATAWERPRGDLRVRLGTDPACLLDLAAQGPHALVAGTTGSGKSELLQAWVLALAVRHPPCEVSFLLVDYKGGSTFTHAARLPHCVGLLTDLDPAGSRRALGALRHELRRRERLLRTAGARDRESFVAGGGRLGRLIVVVDELRALVEDDEERLADLVAVATLGRSLGVHLILATQRPGGVVNGQLRANLTLRVCLRVLEGADALDVVGDARPAGFTEPGQALVGEEACRFAWLPGAAAGELAQVVRGAARRVERRRRADLLLTHRPWLPPLPQRPQPGSVPGPLLLDRPDVPAHQPWRPTDGHVLVTGPARSGRTTALQALVRQHPAVERGCHVLSREGWGDPWWGTVAGRADPDVLVHLLGHVAAGGDPASLVAIDDVEHLCALVDDALGPGRGVDLVAALLTAHRAGPVLVAAAGPHRWVGSVAHHLALGVRDVASAVAVGVDRRLVEARALPGRGVLLSAGEQHAAQVIPAPSTPVRGRGGRPPGVLRLRPLPDLVTSTDLVRASTDAPRADGAADRAGGGVLPLGIGLAGPVGVELRPRQPLVVVGPPASGRTSTLLLLRSLLAADGRRALLVGPGQEPTQEDADVLLVDDAEQLSSDQTSRLLPRLRGTCVVATTPAALAADFRGLVGAARESGHLLALGGFAPGRARPHGPSRPGRGLLVTPLATVPVQVALPPPRPSPGPASPVARPPPSSAWRTGGLSASAAVAAPTTATPTPTGTLTESWESPTSASRRPHAVVAPLGQRRSRHRPVASAASSAAATSANTATG